MDDDGARSLTKESKVGLGTSFLVTTLAAGVLGWLTNLDTSGWSGWAGTAGAAAVGTGIGLVSAYLKRNR